jgi:adenylate cyclase
LDWESEGLLEGLEGEEREARGELLDQLHDAGVDVEDLRAAVRDDRLALLPVELELRGDCDLTIGDLAERTGVSLDMLREMRRGLGLPQVPEDEKAFGEDDVEAVEQLKGFLAAGMDPAGLDDVRRVVGESMDRVARVVAEITANAVLGDGGNERTAGLRFAAAARELTPMMASQLEYVFRLQLREIVRSEVVNRAQIASGELPGGELVNVAFADLVGFTKLGEDLPPDEIGRVAGRLGRLAADLAEPPVRLVKTIGDAAMLVAPETEPLVAATIQLVIAADDEGEDFPQLRAGVARGEAIGRAGDWYGRPVNVASRVTGVARPGSVLVTEEVKDEVEDAFRWSFAGKRRLKNVKEAQALFRARRKEAEAEAED